MQEAHDYYPYGREIVSPSITTRNGSRMRFTVHERDWETETDYMLSRYKPTNLVTFMSPDPIESASPKFPASWNKYSYTTGNPVNFIDPYGLEKREVDCTDPMQSVDVECEGWDDGGGWGRSRGTQDLFDIIMFYHCYYALVDGVIQDVCDPHHLLVRKDGNKDLELGWWTRNFITYGDWLTQGWGHEFAQFWIGVGDGASVGLTKFTRPDDQQIDDSSFAYHAGDWTGTVSGTVGFAGLSAERSVFNSIRSVSKKLFGAELAGVEGTFLGQPRTFEWFRSDFMRWGLGSWKGTPGMLWHFNFGPGGTLHFPWNPLMWKYIRFL